METFYNNKKKGKKMKKTMKETRKGFYVFGFQYDYRLKGTTQFCEGSRTLDEAEKRLKVLKQNTDYSGLGITVGEEISIAEMKAMGLSI